MGAVEVLLVALEEALRAGDVEAAKRLTRQIRARAEQTREIMRLVRDGKWRG